MTITKKRCAWLNLDKPHYVTYHDKEWGIPVYDDQKLFEMLILEGAQAGLSWETILKRREGYREAFKNFDPNLCAKMTDAYLERQLNNLNIIRNRLKVFSVRKNANVFLNIKKEHGSFSNYIWQFVNNKPITNSWKNSNSVPSKTKISDAIAKDLKKQGMSFVGSTIIYAFMQAIGMVNDHTVDCRCYKKKIRKSPITIKN